MSGRYLTDMADVLRRAGCSVVEVDGWQKRARNSGGFANGRPVCVMWHHTASQTTAENDVRYIISADTAPIANLYIARNGDVWVIAAGATNTNGKGQSLRFSRGTVPADKMNEWAIGMEFANSGVGEAYSQTQIDAGFRASLALCDAYGLAPDDVANHADYAPGRKIDMATAAAVQGPWRPRGTNSSGTWSLDDLRAECRSRASTAPLPPEPAPEPTEVEAMGMFVLDSATMGSALLMVRADATWTMRGFNTPAERTAWLAALGACSVTLDDAAYRGWIDGKS